MKKKVLAFVMAAVLTIALLPTVAMGAFSDTGDHAAAQAIETWTGHGVLKGYPDGSFLPDGLITRGEFATVVDRVFSFKTKGADIFTDLGDIWSRDAVLKMVAASIMLGDNGAGGTVRPEDNIMREEAFAMLRRAFGFELDAGGISKFSDADTVSEWMKGEVGAIAHYISEPTIRAREDITRAEVVVTLDNIVKGLFRAAGTVKTPVRGNAVVNAPGVVFDGLRVTGNLYVTQGVGDGDFTMQNGSEVTKTMYVNGGGSKSIKLIGSTVKVVKTYVDPETGTVRIYTDTKSVIETLYVEDGSDDVILEGVFKDVIIEGHSKVIVAENTKVAKIDTTGDDVTLEINKGAVVDLINISGKNANVIVKSGAIVLAMVVTGDGAKIQVEKGATVRLITIRANNVAVSGEGRVEQVNVESGRGNSVTTPGTRVVVSSGAGAVSLGDGRTASPGTSVNVGGSMPTGPTIPGGSTAKTAATPIVTIDVASKSAEYVPGDTIAAIKATTTKAASDSGELSDVSYKWQVSFNGEAFKDVTLSTDGDQVDGSDKLTSTFTPSKAILDKNGTYEYRVVATNKLENDTKTETGTSDPATVRVYELPKIESVTINPASAEVEQGEEQQFTVAVTTSDYKGKVAAAPYGGALVSWSVSENSNKQATTISTEGLLKVADDEQTATPLKVTVTVTLADVMSAETQTATVKVLPTSKVPTATLTYTDVNDLGGTAKLQVGGAGVADNGKIYIWVPGNNAEWKDYVYTNGVTENNILTPLFNTNTPGTKFFVITGADNIARADTDLDENYANPDWQLPGPGVYAVPGGVK